MCLRITLKTFDDLKNKKNSAWSNVFWYVKKCILWKCIQYTIHSHIKHKCQKFPSGKVSGIKSALFYLSQTYTHHSFTFNLWFLYELARFVSLKLWLGFSIFDPVLLLLKFIFVQQNAWILWLLNFIIPFKIKIIQKSHSFSPRHSIFRLQ